MEGFIIIIIGLFQIFLGKRFFKITYILMACLISLSIMKDYYSNYHQAVISWAMLRLIMNVGTVIFLFYFLSTSFFRTVFLTCIGYFCGLYVYKLVADYVNDSYQMLFWFIILQCCVILHKNSMKIMEHFIINSTSLAGGYLIIKGASLYFSNSRIIFELIESMKWGQIKQHVIYC
jgi:hypothetical protein